MIVGNIYDVRTLTAKKSEKYIVTATAFSSMTLTKVMLSKTKIGNIRHPEMMTITFIGNSMKQKKKTKSPKSK